MNKPSKKLLDLAINITGERELEEFPELLKLYTYTLDMEVETKRLNNIINELEKYINEEYIYDDIGMKIFDASKLQDKLEELKGSDKYV